MNPEIESIFKEVGSYINSNISEDWESAWIEVEFEPGVISSTGRYKKPGDEKEYSFLVTGNVGRLFLKLRQTIKKGEETWRKAKYSLQPDGVFKVGLRFSVFFLSHGAFAILHCLNSGARFSDVCRVIHEAIPIKRSVGKGCISGI